MLRFGLIDEGTMEFKAAPGARNAVAQVAQHVRAPIHYEPFGMYANTELVWQI
ncbi:MAG: hypothetical protein AABN95_23680 [Acidobacteriota bacterium]